MKKIINKISVICFMIFDAFVDFLFCIRLLIDLNEKEEDKKAPLYDEYRIKNIKVLLQFLASSFDNSVFEYYCLNNEEYLYQFYLSLKHKNNGIFKFFVFWYAFLINRLLYPVLYSIFGYGWVDKCLTKLNKIVNKQIENNFGYEYLRDYKRYWKDDKEYYKQIRFKVFFKETIINLCCKWNDICIKYHWPKLVIYTDTLFFDIERYF